MKWGIPLETLQKFAKKRHTKPKNLHKNLFGGPDSNPRPSAWQTSNILRKTEAEATLVWQSIEASL